MDHQLHPRLDISEISTNIIEGCTIYDPLDETVGQISHLHGQGPTANVAVEIGTFLGMGGKTVLIPVSALDFMRDQNGSVHAVTTWNKAEIEGLPAHLDP